MTDDHPLFAALYDPLTKPAETVFAPHREWLAKDLSGHVLDVGTGTGAMFPYYAAARNSAHQTPDDTSAGDRPSLTVSAVEPDRHMRRRAVTRAEEAGLDVTIYDAGAESIPLADDSVDVAVVSLVLCTVDDLDASIDELARVLRPGGELRILEHVHAGGVTGSVQSAVTPAWKRVAAGCHLDRESGDRLLADDRFETLEFERLDSSFPLVTPLVRGRFRRKRDRDASTGLDALASELRAAVDTLLPTG
ncbi:class I SAM-dependent methyltransferase [Haloarchaeobius amylolyticus]|uniref:class I SAM-dependent methyltransferase n=1 Tax=Haloarchaeobius amylolyticus TaxID=1198296 RepID=UPI0022713D5A|nr:class I SAM-dependent methyltransferase [Haloarchaeobius amylolyticus]